MIVPACASAFPAPLPMPMPPPPSPMVWSGASWNTVGSFAPGPLPPPRSPALCVPHLLPPACVPFAPQLVPTRSPEPGARCPNRRDLLVVISRPPAAAVTMQLPANAHTPAMPIHYSSYFASTPQAAHTRPIRINHHLNGSYDFTSRVRELNFAPAIVAPSTAESFYVMDFMDCDEPASTSATHSPTSTRTESLEEAMRRAVLADDNKENAAARPLQQQQQPSGDGLFPSGSNVKVIGEPGMRGYKRRGSFDDELINEETESETGFSDDEMDECASNCGFVHSSSSIEPRFSRLGFRSIGDIIGYAQVVRAERLEAMAELRSAVDKFNDYRQRNAQARARQLHQS